MKKALFFLSIILLLGTVGCEKADAPKNPIVTQTIEQTEPQIEYEPERDVYYDMNAFLTDWPHGEQLADNTMAGINSTDGETSITVPILKSTDFVLHHIAVNEYYYFYYFISVDYEKPYFDYDHGILITLSHGKSFSSIMDQHDLTPVNGIAYDGSRNTWYLDKDGKCLDVAFPASLPVTTEEELYSYFDFEEYTASGNSGEVQ